MEDDVTVLSSYPTLKVKWSVYSELYSNSSYVGVYSSSEKGAKCLSHAYFNCSTYPEDSEEDSGKNNSREVGFLSIPLKKIKILRKVFENKEKEILDVRNKAAAAGDDVDKAVSLCEKSLVFPEECNAWEIRLYTQKSRDVPLVRCPFIPL